MRWPSKKGRNYLVSTLLQFLGFADWLGKPRCSDRRGISVPTSA
jgi:hypothetical protein